jgi:hypothetical protein
VETRCASSLGEPRLPRRLQRRWQGSWRRNPSLLGKSLSGSARCLSLPWAEAHRAGAQAQADSDAGECQCRCWTPPASEAPMWMLMGSLPSGVSARHQHQRRLASFGPCGCYLCRARPCGVSVGHAQTPGIARPGRDFARHAMRQQGDMMNLKNVVAVFTIIILFIIVFVHIH